MSARGAPERAARVAVLIVTWNRKEHVSNVLGSVAKQTHGAGNLDVVVIDNAGTDGTLEHLVREFQPEAVVNNPTERAHEPRFELSSARVGEGRNRLGFASLTVVRNGANMGGCGGFNTGFAFVEQGLKQRPDYLWLVDDDADVAPDTLEQLAKVMDSNADVGLVGSRTVDIRDRRSTIETTIYYNDISGAMQDDAPKHHARFAAHEAWVKRVGGTRGDRVYTGTMDVDVVSACSMLARWDAVVGGAKSGGREAVGFWDARYFIYCDDADWCLRFAKHGWRVVLSLDAVVFHTPWNLKLTPARIYYANRNKVWMAQKILPTGKLRRVTRKAMLSMLKDSLRASMLRRTFHAEIILDTARDVAIGRSGKTGSDGPAAEGVYDALLRSGGLSAGARVAVLCSHPESLLWMRELKAHVEREAKTRGADVPSVRWVAVVRNDVPGAVPEGAVVYGGRWTSRLKKQMAMLKVKPTVCVVFDQTNDFPVWTPLAAGYNVHIDQKKPTVGQVERDGWLVRGKFAARWVVEAVRCVWYAQTVKPFVRAGRYG